MRALITGANRGIGAAMLTHGTTAGHEMLGTSRTGDAPLLSLDVTDLASITDLAETLGDAPLDQLVCNAGIFADRGQSLDTGYPPQMWAEGFETNVTGVFLTIQALLPHLRRAPAGKIAIISSQMASDTRAPGGSYIYRASKAAVLNLGRNLATDLCPEGIAVGIYHPGWVQTDMGGGSADITVDQSATGLLARFATLSLDTTGCFETWDGQPHAF